MTKRDLRSIALASAASVGGLLAIWFFFRRSVTVPVLQPVQVKWEGQ